MKIKKLALNKLYNCIVLQLTEGEEAHIAARKGEEARLAESKERGKGLHQRNERSQWACRKLTS